MSRAGAGDVVVVKPANNVYTIMLIVATLVQLLTLLIIVVRFKSAFGALLFTS
jgi:hypothetical protein